MPAAGPTQELRELRRLPIHRSLVSPVQYVGCQREMLGLLVLFCLWVVFSVGLSVVGLVLGGTILVAGVRRLRRLTRADAQFPFVYARYYRLADEYEAEADIDTPVPAAPASASGSEWF